MKKAIPIGYWYNPKLPKETAKYPKVENYKNDSLNIREKQKLIYFLKTFGEKLYTTNYRGCSKCRICNKLLGSGEDIRIYEGEKYIIPHKFEHYILEHNILVPLPNPLQRLLNNSN